MIYLEDYFPNGEWPDSIAMDANLTFVTDSARNVVKVEKAGEGLPWLSTLDLFYGKHVYNILVRRAREANVTITFDPKGKTYQTVQVAGEINGWNPANGPMTFDGKNWSVNLRLNPGRYQYQIVVDGKWMLDPGNPVKVPNGIGGVNSELVVGEKLGRTVEKVTLRCGLGQAGSISILPIVTDSIVHPLPIEDVFAFWENERISIFEPKDHSKDNNLLKIPEAAKSMKRSYIRVFAANGQFWTNDVLIPLENGKPVIDAAALTEADQQKNVIYFMMVDRFLNGDTTNDAPLNDPRVDAKADFHGGDIAGLKQKIEDGYFDSLGVTMLWISPIVQNPEGAYQEYPEPRRWFSGYHGYWPVSSTHVDHRFGTDQELIDMVKAAHAHGIKVILDYVANHLHEEHPMIKADPEWKTELYL